MSVLSTLAPPLSLDVTTGTDADVIVRVGGHLVVRTAPEVRQALDAAVGGAPRSIVVDLEAVSELDTAGLVAVTAPILRGRRSSIRTSVVPPDAPAARKICDRVGVVPILNGTG